MQCYPYFDAHKEEEEVFSSICFLFLQLRVTQGQRRLISYGSWPSKSKVTPFAPWLTEPLGQYKDLLDILDQNWKPDLPNFMLRKRPALIEIMNKHKRYHHKTICRPLLWNLKVLVVFFSSSSLSYRFVSSLFYLSLDIIKLSMNISSVGKRSPMKTNGSERYTKVNSTRKVC